MYKKGILILLILILGGFCLLGCQRDGASYKIGYLDLSKIMNTWPKALELKAKYQDESSQLMNQLPQDPSKLTSDQRQKLQSETEKFNKDKNALFADVTTQAEKIRKQKGLDLIIVNVGIPYGGIDITSDFINEAK